ncbi:MAG: phosphoribosylformylglycinamidine synthase subunit PurS [Trueperaceae bacterium]|nr:phosphoribosylformylglycinamidine synthase subunit PurS [Trueperaceae bacterium]
MSVRTRAHVTLAARAGAPDPDADAARAALRAVGADGVLDVAAGRIVVFDLAGAPEAVAGEVRRLADALVRDPELEVADVALEALDPDAPDALGAEGVQADGFETDGSEADGSQAEAPDGARPDGGAT